MKDTTKIFWSKRISREAEGIKDIQHSYSNECFYRVPVAKDVTLEEIEQFKKDNNYNWHTVSFHGFGIYAGEYFAYFSLDIGIGD